jgi:hypothetical protein
MVVWYHTATKATSPTSRNPPSLVPGHVGELTDDPIVAGVQYWCKMSHGRAAHRSTELVGGTNSACSRCGRLVFTTVDFRRSLQPSCACSRRDLRARFSGTRRELDVVGAVVRFSRAEWLEKWLAGQSHGLGVASRCGTVSSPASSCRISACCDSRACRGPPDTCDRCNLHE